MKIFPFFLIIIPLCNSHKTSYEKLIEEMKHNPTLKGSFTINCVLGKDLFFSAENGTVLLTDVHRQFDINEMESEEPNIYIIYSRRMKKVMGVNEANEIVLYDKDDKENKKKILWKITRVKNTLNYYLIKNLFNHKYLICKDKFLKFSNKFGFNSNNQIEKKFQFRILKLFEEQRNVKEEYLEIVEKEPIDVFIKYIDLSDRTLNRTGIKQTYKDEDNEELRYSVRSILQYIPWVRKIFIIMPNKKVRYFKPIEKIKDRIVYVNDKDFLGYDSANIFAFSFSLYKMEKFNISKNFIYMEDDYFIGKPLKKSDFFYYDEKEKKVFPYVVTNYFEELDKKSRLDYYKELYSIKNTLKAHGNKGWIFSVLSTDKYIVERYNIPIISTDFTHCARAENIDDMREIFEEIQYYKYINETLYSPTRHVMTLNQPHFVNLYQLNIKRRKVRMIPSQYINMEDVKDYSLDIELFVLNTCGDNIPTKEEYNNLRKTMKERFPTPTPYEIINNIDEKEEKNISSTLLNSDKNINESRKINETIISDINNKNKYRNISSTFLKYSHIKDEKNKTGEKLYNESIITDKKEKIDIKHINSTYLNKNSVINHGKKTTRESSLVTTNININKNEIKNNENNKEKGSSFNSNSQINENKEDKNLSINNKNIKIEERDNDKEKKYFCFFLFLLIIVVIIKLIKEYKTKQLKQIVK